MNEDIDVLLLHQDDGERRRTRQLLLDHAHEPSIKDYLEAEARLAVHRDRIMRQAEVVSRKMDIAERDVSHLVTTKWIHQAGRFDDRLNAATLHMGPELGSVTADARVQECMNMLLGGSPEFVDDVNFISQMSAFAHPTETIDSSCVAMQKLITEAYGTAHELTACVNPQHAPKLSGMVGNSRRVYASLAQLAASVHRSSIATRAEIEKTQGQIETLKQHQIKAVRLGKELMKENETLRRQLFRATVVGFPSEEDASAALVLSDAGVEVQRGQCRKLIVLLQVEGCHELRFKSPVCVSESLLLVQSLIESLITTHKGSRVNFNPLHETHEHFNRATNRRFAPESYAFSFNTAGNAILFVSDLHEHLARNARWPDTLYEHAKFKEISVVDGAPTIVWRGLKIRAAMHAGTPYVSFPLADAVQDASDEQQAAELAMIPFYGGLCMEKTMLLLQKTRAGETLMTQEAMKLFDAERYTDTTLSHTISTIEREIPGMQVGFGPDEKVHSAVPRVLTLRLTPAPSPVAYLDVVECVFPSTAFWRQIDQINEFLPTDFDDDNNAFTAGSMLPQEYEAKIDELKFEIDKLRGAVRFHEENNQRLSVDAIRSADERAAERKRADKVEKRHERYATLMARVPSLSAAVEKRAFENYDLYAAAEASLVDARVQIESLKQELTTAKRATPSFVDTNEMDVNTEVPYPDVKEIFARGKRSAGISASAPDRPNSCQSCAETSSLFASVSQFAAGCADKFKDALQGSLSASELIKEFNLRAAHAVFATVAEPAEIASAGGLVGVAEKHGVTYEKLCEGTTRPDAFPVREDLMHAMITQLAHITRIVCRFTIAKSIGAKMKSMSATYTDELDYLSTMNSKLEEKMADVTVARKRDAEKHRDTLIATQLEAANDIAKAEARHQEFEMRIKMLSLKLQETSDRAQGFFDETCRLMDQVETSRATDDANNRVKSSFETLKQTYAMGSEVTEVERVLRENNSRLARTVAVLEARVKARDSELNLRQKYGGDDAAARLHEMDQARLEAEDAVRAEAEAQREEWEQDKDRAVRAAAAEASAAEMQRAMDERLKTESRRIADEKRREQLRAAREEFERDEWKRSLLEQMVDEEVQRRLELSQWGRALGSAGSVPSTPGVNLPPLPSPSHRGRKGGTPSTAMLSHEEEGDEGSDADAGLIHRSQQTSFVIHSLPPRAGSLVQNAAASLNASPRNTASRHASPRSVSSRYPSLHTDGGGGPRRRRR
jgi:hypothetical protein